MYKNVLTQRRYKNVLAIRESFKCFIKWKDDFVSLLFVNSYIYKHLCTHANHLSSSIILFSSKYFQ